MSSTADFSDRLLTKDFYRALFNRFYESCDLSSQASLSQCTLGIAPSQNGVRTFFIVAPNQRVAEDLTQEVDSLLKKVVRLMPGVDQTAICFVPVERQQDYQAVDQDLTQGATQFMLGKIFNNPSEAENLF